MAKLEAPRLTEAARLKRDLAFIRQEINRKIEVLRDGPMKSARWRSVLTMWMHEPYLKGAVRELKQMRRTEKRLHRRLGELRKSLDRNPRA